MNRLWSWIEPNPAKTIVILGAVMAVVLMAIAPAQRYIPDERSHFYRAYQLSELHIVSRQKQPDGFGDYLPASLVTFGNPIHQALNPQQKTWIRFDGSAAYSPVPYITDVPGIFVARILKLTPTMILYAGRLSNLLTWLVLVYIALRLAGKWAWSLGVFALLPMAIFQSVNVTADVMTVGLTMVFVALLLRALTAKEKIDKRELTWLVVTSVLLSLCKQPLFILPLTACAIPAERFASRKARWQSLAWIILPGVILALFWTMLVRGVNVTNGNLIANPHQQILFMIHNPISFIQAVLATHLPNTSYLLIESLTTPALWLGLHTVLWSVMLSYALIVYAALQRPDKSIGLLSRRQKLIVVLVTLVAFLSIDTTLYLYFSTVGAPKITGLQGRYFLPLLILLVPVIKNKSTYIQTSQRSVSRVLLLGSLIPFTVFCVLLVHGYPMHALRYKLLFLGNKP